MDGTKKKLAAGAVAVAALAGGGAALAAGGLGSEEEQQAVIDDAAKRLGVEPEALENALEGALGARLDEAVKEGRLTEEQAAELKERLKDGTLPLFGGRGHHGHGLRAPRAGAVRCCRDVPRRHRGRAPHAARGGEVARRRRRGRGQVGRRLEGRPRRRGRGEAGRGRGSRPAHGRPARRGARPLQGAARRLRRARGSRPARRGRSTVPPASTARPAACRCDAGRSRARRGVGLRAGPSSWSGHAGSYRTLHRR